MSVSLYMICLNLPDEVIIVVGNNELQQSWLPIVLSNECIYLEQAFSAGLSIDDENYKDVIEESSLLLDILRERTPFENEIINPVYRCSRMLQLLKDNPPGSGVDLYIG